jgi:hypothetical protein
MRHFQVEEERKVISVISKTLFSAFSVIYGNLKMVPCKNEDVETSMLIVIMKRN